LYELDANIHAAFIGNTDILDRENSSKGANMSCRPLALSAAVGSDLPQSLSAGRSAKRPAADYQVRVSKQAR
jgi:hypothetical protein